MYRDPRLWDRINSYALVSYIPEPLAGFLDRLRQELVPNCFLHAHITVLPPRPVAAPEDAWRTLKNLIPLYAPFEVQMTDVEVFPVSDVIYVDIAKGSEQLRPLHDALAVEGLQSHEEYSYHPHVTLAQDLKPDELDELLTVARARWAEVRFEKTFRVEKLVFVQNTRTNEWIDLAECMLGEPHSEIDGELTGLLAR